MRPVNTSLRDMDMDPVCFHMRCLRNILKIKWQDRIPDTEVLKRAGNQSLYPILRSRRLRWLGHVARMNNSRIPKQILYGCLYEGTHEAERPKLRFRDQCKTSMMEFSVNVAQGYGFPGSSGVESCSSHRSKEL